MEAEPSGEPVRTALVPVGGAADNLIRFFFQRRGKHLWDQVTTTQQMAE